MAAVVFALGSHPGVDEPDALELIELLVRTRNIAAVRAAKKIGDQARRNPDRGEATPDITLDRDEMIEVFALLSQPSATPISDAMRNLQHELVVVLSGS
jgi:hypothetical protein